MALDYHNPAGFNCKDETKFRNFIVYRDWPKFFEKYLRYDTTSKKSSVSEREWPESGERTGQRWVSWVI
uniref:Uncharacterized protein n=1 Tax=Equus caballus TaxID=9796 RepID=A0A9L0TK12_HORSE